MIRTMDRHIDSDEREYLEERTAIIQFDGGLPEYDAQVLAYTCYIHKYRPNMVPWYPWPKGERVLMPVA